MSDFGLFGSSDGGGDTPTRLDKNQAIIDYLLQCTDITGKSIYFNLINESNDSIQIITTAEDKMMNKPYIDGSIDKRYTFNIIVFKSITDSPLVTQEGYTNENVDDLAEVQTLIDWINDQQDLGNYPDFGEDCQIDEISTTTETPRFDGINSEMNPPLAMYSISIVIQYLDKSKMLW